MTGAVSSLAVLVSLLGQVIISVPMLPTREEVGDFPQSISDCGVPVLREGAADLVKASFKKGFRLTDFTKIEIQATPYNLVEDGACIDGDKMVLEYNNDGGEDWTALEIKPKSTGGGKYKFTVEDVVPCKDHYFKILLQGEGKLFQISVCFSKVRQER